MVEKNKIIFIFSFFFKNCTSLGPNWSILLGSCRAKLRKSSKVEFIGANSDFGGVEMVPVPPVLA